MTSLTPIRAIKELLKIPMLLDIGLVRIKHPLASNIIELVSNDHFFKDEFPADLDSINISIFSYIPHGMVGKVMTISLG
ncbi:unnamed protein product [Cochlearia groenlandica]